MKRTPLCQLPTPMTVVGRSSTLTNAFINAIIPVVEPTEAEELEALRILGIDPISAVPIVAIARRSGIIFAQSSPIRSRPATSLKLRIWFLAAASAISRKASPTGGLG